MRSRITFVGQIANDHIQCRIDGAEFLQIIELIDFTFYEQKMSIIETDEADCVFFPFERSRWRGSVVVNALRAAEPPCSVKNGAIKILSKKSSGGLIYK